VEASRISISTNGWCTCQRQCLIDPSADVRPTHLEINTNPVKVVVGEESDWVSDTPVMESIRHRRQYIRRQTLTLSKHCEPRGVWIYGEMSLRGVPGSIRSLLWRHTSFQPVSQPGPSKGRTSFLNWLPACVGLSLIWADALNAFSGTQSDEYVRYYIAWVGRRFTRQQ